MKKYIPNPFASIPVETFELSSFSESFSRCCAGMRINGVYPKDRTVVSQAWLALVVTTISSAIFLLGSTAVKDIINLKDYSDATRQLSLVFLFMVMLIKMFSMVYYRPTLLGLMDSVDDDYKFAEEHFTKEELLIVKKYAISGIWVQKIWSYLVMFVGCVFPTACISMMIHSVVVNDSLEKKMIFYCIVPWYDEQKYETPVYEILFVYQAIVDLTTVSLLVAFDPLMPIFSLHICGQLELINGWLAELFDHGERLDRKFTKQRLSKIIQNLQRIYRMSDDMNTMTSFVYEAIFAATPVLSTASAFQIFTCLKTGELPYEFAFFFVATVAHPFIPSFYGTILFDKSISVSEAAYFSEWEKVMDPEARTTLLTVMLRAQRPLTLTTMFIPVNLQLFSEVGQRSWTMFNLLRAVFE